MRLLGLDLGTKSCGISISDRSNTICTPREPIFYEHEDYQCLLDKLKVIIKDNDITDVVIGMPVNMDGSMGFASERSINFSSMLKELGVEIHFVDERLTTVQAMSILHFTGKKEKDGKKVIDSVSANLILETYMKTLGGSNEK